MKEYDLIIVGGGSAGFTAGIYASRARLKTLIIEKYVFGGQVANTFEIKNYPGFESITGAELAQKMLNHAQKCGVEILNDSVLDFDFKADIKLVKTEYSGTLGAKAIILAMGAEARKLGAKNEDKFAGHGVSYCAVCDGSLFRDKVVAVVGGGNSALGDACYLTSLAKKVYLIHRKDDFKAQQILIDQVKQLVKQNKIELLLFSTVDEVFGDQTVSAINVKNLKTNDLTKIDVDGLFVTVGREPDTISIDSVDKDENGYILTNDSMETNILGVYAAGDCRKKELRQIVTACSDGAVAATKANMFIKAQKRKQNS